MRASTSPLEALSRGVALAALRHGRVRPAAGDPGNERALSSLPAPCRDRVRALLGKHTDRAALERALAVGLERRVAEEPALGAKARALLATHAPSKEVGRSWIRAAPPLRHGYVASEALLAVLVALGANEARAETAAVERDFGARLIAGNLEFARVSDEELALDSELDEHVRRWKGLDSPLRERVIRVARQMATSTDSLDVHRTIGAVALGYCGAGEGDADSEHHRRAGAELRELQEAGCLG